jgi:hypothetical protein
MKSFCSTTTGASIPRALAAALGALSMAACTATPRTQFELSAEPPGAAWVGSWGAGGPLPAEVEPPAAPGRHWVDVELAGHHTQRVRFEFEDLARPADFTDQGQRLFGLLDEVAAGRDARAREPRYSLDFSSIHVRLVPLAEPPVYTVDVEIGTATDRVRID